MTVREHMALRLAASTYKYAAVRDTHAMEQLGYRPVQFWAVVNGLLDRADVEATYPREVRRLRRLREARRAVRTARAG